MSPSGGERRKQWLASDAVTALSLLPDWPTAETKAMWDAFVLSFAPQEASIWKEHHYLAWVRWHPGLEQAAGTPIRVHHINGHLVVLSSDGLHVGDLDAALNPSRCGLVHAAVMEEPGKISITYLGPDDLLLGITNRL